MRRWMTEAFQTTDDVRTLRNVERMGPVSAIHGNPPIVSRAALWSWSYVVRWEQCSSTRRGIRFREVVYLKRSVGSARRSVTAGSDCPSTEVPRALP
jgi:hypothetical protein